MIAPCKHQTRVKLKHLKGRDLVEAQHVDGNNGRSAPLETKDTGFVALLRDCAKSKDFCRGARLHAHLLKRGLLEKSSCAIVSMYAKCGVPEKAQELLHELPTVDVFTWTALIDAYAQQGYAQHALHCFEQMRREDIPPDAVTFTCILKACGSIGALDKGENIHNQISNRGLLGKNVVLGTALVDMYAKCGALEKAAQVLEGLSVRDVVSWNTLLAGYIQHGQNHNALSCFEKMQHEGLSPNASTFMYILKVCGIIGAVDKGKQIHDEVIRQGLLANNVLLGKAVVDMYAKCGALAKAQRLLEELPVQDIILWSMLITQYVQQGQGEEALACLEHIERKGLSLDEVTFICILKACGCVGAIDKGKYIHAEISKQGLLRDNILLGTALVDMYVKCGAIAKAHEALDKLPVRDVITWSALIAGYAQMGQGEEALIYFDQMQCEGISPNAVTYICVLKACGSLGAIQKGGEIHDQVTEQGFLQHNVALGNALADMYAKCGVLSKAHRVLEELPLRDAISWNILIAGYSQQGQGQEALTCFNQMEHEGFYPDAVTFTCLLKACGSIGAVDKGEEIHDEIARQGLLGEDVVLGTALLDMYAKCGSFARAQEVLDHLPVEDVVSWSALLGGYAEFGHGEGALNCFKQMQYRGLTPDAVTFSCALNACIHSGLAEEGQTFFANMKKKYDFNPDIDHYAYLVDLFGHLGHLDKAARVIERMPDSEVPAAWASLLSVCQKWGDVNVGKWAFEHAIRLEKSEATPYICMANIYAAAGMREEVENIEALRVTNSAWEKRVCRV